MKKMIGFLFTSFLLLGMINQIGSLQDRSFE